MIWSSSITWRVTGAANSWIQILDAVLGNRAFDFIEQATAGVPVYMGLIQEDGLERILNGRVTLSAGAPEQFYGCVAQLLKETESTGAKMNFL